MSRCPIRVFVVAGSLLLLVLTSPRSTSARRSTLEGVEVHDEDFTSYTYLDQMDQMDWNPFSGSLQLRAVDAVPREWSDLVFDGVDSVYVVWMDERNGDADIYMQRVDEEGNRLWEHDLRVNSDAAGNRQGPPVVALMRDRSALVAWVDSRNGSEEEKDIYAQRVTAEGAKSWSGDRQLNVTSSDTYWHSLSLSAANSPNAIASWAAKIGSDNDRLYLQRVDATGTPSWASDLEVIQAQADWRHAYTGLATDSEGNILLAWPDVTSVKVRKFSSDGTALWDEAVSLEVDGGYGDVGLHPAIAVSPNDEIYIAWRKVLRYDIYAQKLSSDGQLMWDDAAQLCDLRHTQPGNRVEIALDGDDGAVVVWDGYEGYKSHLGMWARRVRSNGTVDWASPLRLGALSDRPSVATGPVDQVLVTFDGVRFNRLDAASGQLLEQTSPWVSEANGTVGQREPSVSYSPTTDVVVGWRSLHASSSEGHSVQLRSFDPQGTPRWQKPVRANRDEGQVYYSEAYHQPSLPIQTSTSPAGDTIAAWTDFRQAPEGPLMYSVYAQSVDKGGNLLWSTDVLIDPMGGYAQGIAATPDGGAVISYWSAKPVTETWRYGTCLQRVAPSGEPVWSERVWISEKEYPSEVGLAVADDGSHYVNDDKHLSRISEAGEILWQDGSYGDERVATAVDSAGDILLVWEGYDEGAVIYGQKLDSDGVEVWPTQQRISVSMYASVDGRPDVAIDEDGFAVAVWEDGDSGTIRAQGIDSDGNQTWGSDLVVSANRESNQSDPSVAVDGSGKAYVGWTDQRNGNADIYMQGLSASGTHLWTSDIQAVSPDFYYFSQGTAQSRNVNTAGGLVVEANLTGQYILQGGSLTFYLTNDGGEHWAEVTPGVTHVFTTTGSDLCWRAEMTANPTWGDKTPILEHLRVEYTTVSSEGDDYEPDDTCAQASPLQVNGAVQAHTLHQAHDKDWAWFGATEGTTYVLQTAHAGPNADTVLELHDVCHHPILTDTNAFGRDARLTFTAPSDGTYYARVTNHDGSLYGQGTDYDLSVRTYHPNGLAVVVAGHNDRWQLQSNIDYAADQAYLTFLEAGFPKANVRYLGPDPDRDVDGNESNDDIAATATITNVRYAVQDWPREQGLGLGIPFYVYLMDHGHYDLFLADGDAGRVTAPLLDLWLSNLEATTGADQITVVIDACKSGSFIDVTGVGPDEISGANRVVVASTTSQANAYPSQRGALFSDAFWTALGDNQDVWSSYRAAKAAVDARGLMQTPWLDDNGDAVASDDDGDLARGRGLAGMFGGGEPVIDWLEVGEVSASGEATVSAQVRDDFAVMDVYVEVYPPGYEEPEAPPGETPVVGVPTTTLTLETGEVYEATLTELNETGSYRVVGYAVDDEGNWALPRWASVPVAMEEKVYLPLVMRVIVNGG